LKCDDSFSLAFFIHLVNVGFTDGFFMLKFLFRNFKIGLIVFLGWTFKLSFKLMTTTVFYGKSSGSFLLQIFILYL